MSDVLDQNPSRPQTRIREASKWLLWRALPRPWYQRLLARAKARDFRSGAFREPELDLVALALEAGGTAIDVGANHGMWTMAFSEEAGTGGQVLSFEPVPFTFGTLEALTEELELGNVSLFPLGCSDEAGSSEMAVPRQDTGASDDLQAHLADRKAVSDHREVETICCELVRLDDIVGDLERIDIIKLDIEGAELKALAGAREALARHRPTVICEVDRGYLAGFGQTPEELQGFMAGLGYRAHRFVEEGPALSPMESLDSVVHGNVVFFTAEKHERFASLIS